MLFEEYCDNYLESKIIDLKKELTNKDLAIIEKLEVNIEDGFYTQSRYEDVKEDLGIYYSNYDADREQRYIKPLKYGVTKKEFDYLSNRFSEIDKKYEEMLEGNYRRKTFKDIWLKEKQHIRNKLMYLLEKDILTDYKKQKILEIVINMKDATDMQKERFVLYYGLDKKQKRIHNASKIAELQNCTSSNIRQSINNIKLKIVRLPDEQIETIRKIIKQTNLKSL